MRVYHLRMSTLSAKLGIGLLLAVLVLYGIYKFYGRPDRVGTNDDLQSRVTVNTKFELSSTTGRTYHDKDDKILDESKANFQPVDRDENDDNDEEERQKLNSKSGHVDENDYHDKAKEERDREQLKTKFGNLDSNSNGGENEVSEASNSQFENQEEKAKDDNEEESETKYEEREEISNDIKEEEKNSDSQFVNPDNTFSDGEKDNIHEVYVSDNLISKVVNQEEEIVNNKGSHDQNVDERFQSQTGDHEKENEEQEEEEEAETQQKKDSNSDEGATDISSSEERDQILDTNKDQSDSETDLAERQTDEDKSSGDKEEEENEVEDKNKLLSYLLKTRNTKSVSSGGMESPSSADTQYETEESSPSNIVPSSTEEVLPTTSKSQFIVGEQTYQKHTNKQTSSDSTERDSRTTLLDLFLKKFLPQGDQTGDSDNLSQEKSSQGNSSKHFYYREEHSMENSTNTMHLRIPASHSKGRVSASRFRHQRHRHDIAKRKHQFSKNSKQNAKLKSKPKQNSHLHKEGHINNKHRSIYPNGRMLRALNNSNLVSYKEGYLNDSTFYREIKPVHRDYNKHSIILLHSSKFTSSVWVNIGTLHTLGETGHHTIAIDLPGYGRSMNATIPYSNDEIIVYMIELFQSLKMTLPVVVAPSKSGEYVMPLVMTHPNLMAGIIAIAPTHTSDYTRRAYEKINLPALVLLGKADTTMLNWASLDNLEHLKRRKIFAIANATTDCYVDQPMTFHKLVLRFLGSLKKPW